MKRLKVVIVHDYLIDYGGADVVLAELHEIYPKAPIYTLIVDKKGMGRFWNKFSDAEIKTSWFNYLPYSSKIISPLRFLIPLLWRQFDFSKYDLIITSASWAVTKGMRKGGGTIEICYCHTPPRYLYGYDTSRNWKGKWFSKLVDIYALIVNHFMRIYDFERAQKVDYFIANSKNVGNRIKKFYRRDSAVIYPPVETERIQKVVAAPSYQLLATDYYLAGGRMVASKNFDLIIKACQKAKVKLKIFGSGLEEENLRKIADDNIEFLGEISEDELISYYKSARAFIVAQRDEDFGITPVEAMAAGTMVIAFRGGGYLETVVEDRTGIFFDQLTVDSLADAIIRFNDLNQFKIKPEDCINQAKKFSKERFVSEIKEFVNSKIKN